MSCTSEELAASELPQSKIYCLTNGQSIGLTVRFSVTMPAFADYSTHKHRSQLDAEAGIASILASIAVLLLVAVSSCARYPVLAHDLTSRQRNISACFRNPPSENWRLFEKPPDVYLVSYPVV